MPSSLLESQLFGHVKSPSTNSREAVFGTREAFPRG
jgi:transcriptional regulator with GAF, ATPase, and Fis domain